MTFKVIYDGKAPHHLWRLGRVVDIIPYRDDISAAKIKVGKTGAIINEPVNNFVSFKMFKDV